MMNRIYPQDIPPGLNSDGEVVDFAAYEAWAQTSHQTRDMTRREESTSTMRQKNA
jgi:hypothetical protein